MKRAGIFRKPRRIQEVLDGHRMSFADLARELAVSPSLVSQAIHGVNNNRRVLWRLLELGVTPGDLDLPRDMRGRVANNSREVA